MPASIKNLVANSEILALTFRQRLEPIEGPDVPVLPDSRNGRGNRFERR